MVGSAVNFMQISILSRASIPTLPFLQALRNADVVHRVMELEYEWSHKRLRSCGVESWKESTTESKK